MEYTVLAEVAGRGKADIIESYLRAEEIDVVLVEEAVSHLTHVISFAPVTIYVPKVSIRRARALLMKFNETQNDSKEKSGMDNKKKIEARLEAERRARQTRYIQIAGAVVIFVIVAALAFSYFSNRGKAADVPQVTSKQYSAYPPMTIDTGLQYFATFKMAKGGEFVVQLYAEKAPKTVNSFVFLAREGFYNGVTFHRVLDGFMAQGGDPTGTGTGGPGYSFEDEFDSSLVFDKAGILAMANSGPNTNGSQFFITYGPTEHLNNQHTIFGQVIEGMDVVNSLTRRDPNQFPDYPGDAIETIEIKEQ